MNSDGSDDACTNGDVWSSVMEYSCGQHLKSIRIMMSPFHVLLDSHSQSLKLWKVQLADVQSRLGETGVKVWLCWT